MMIFNDVTPDSSHLCTQNGFKAVIARCSGVIGNNARQDWALHELEIDADDYRWIASWTETLSPSVVSYWLQISNDNFEDTSLQYPAVIGTLFILQAIDHCVMGRPLANDWPLPIKRVFPSEVGSLLFNDDEPGPFYLRAINLAARKLKIKTGISENAKQWLRETIALQIRPDVANRPTTPAWIAVAQAHVLEQTRPANISVRTNDLFPDIDPQAGAAYVEMIAQRILSRASERSFINRPWSLAELFPTDIDYIWLRIWIKKLDANTVRHCLNQSHRFAWSGREYPFQAALGLVLLLWISEEARRKAAEGWLWKWIPRDAFQPEVRQILFNQQNPSPMLKDAIEVAARRFNLRHVFGVEGTQQWMDTVFLQIGFTQRGMQVRLPYWLAGQTQTFSIKNLLDQQAGSEKFIELWNALKQCRQGIIDTEQVISKIQDNPWILPEWIPGIVTVARYQIDQEYAIEGDSDAGVESALVSTPMFRWLPPASPYFVCKLGDLSHLDLFDQVYTIEVNGHPVSQLNRQPNGRYLINGAEELRISLENPFAKIRIVSSQDEVLASQIVELWPENEDVTVFRLANGRMVDDPYQNALTTNVTYAILTQSDLRIDPQPASWVNLSRYRLYYLPSGWGKNTKVLLDDFVLWEPVIDTPIPTPSIAAQITLQLDNNHPKSLIRWGEKIYVKVNHPAEARIHFVRYNGKELDFNQLTPQSGRIGPVKVAPGSTKDLLELKIGLVHDGRLVRLTKNLEVHQIGVARLIPNGWIAESKNYKLGVETARRSKFKIKPPKYWNDAERQTSDWSLMEGDLWVKRLSIRQGPVGTLSGWGAPITLRLGPYNAEKDAMTIAESVIDHGILRDVDLTENQVILNLSTDINPDDRYSVVVWHTDGKITQHRPVRGETNYQWTFESNIPMSDLLAMGISFEKYRLGAWWKNDWASNLATAAANDPQLMAEMIRWLHLPILSNNCIDQVRKVAHEYPTEFLTAWLQPETAGSILQPGELNEGWLAAIRSIFINLNPEAVDVDQLFKNLSAAQFLNVRVSEVSWRLLKVDPRLLFKVIKKWISQQQDTTDARQIVKNIRHQFAEANNEDAYAAKMSALISDSAREWGVDEFFITNGIVSRAVASTDLNPLTRRDEMNIALAISSETLRRLLAISLLKLLS
jgi:hypothetical protein